jgi:hypothetical protein
VPLDYISAYRWYASAVQSGDSRGREKMKDLSRIMTKRQMAAAEIPVQVSTQQCSGNTFRDSFATQH